VGGDVSTQGGDVDAVATAAIAMADGAVVDYHDPYVPALREDGKEHSSVRLSEAALAEADAVVILTDHSAFDYGWIADHSRVLIDARHAVPRAGRDLGPGWVVKS